MKKVWIAVLFVAATFAFSASAYNTGGQEIIGCLPQVLVTDHGHQLQFCKALFWRPHYGMTTGLYVTYLGPYTSQYSNGVTLVVNGQYSIMYGTQGSTQKWAAFYEMDTSQPGNFAIVFDNNWDSRVQNGVPQNYPLPAM